MTRLLRSIGTCFLIGGCAVALGMGVEGCAQEGDTIVYPATDAKAGDPFGTNWSLSGHADINAEPFNHWNDDGEISTSCAKCHSTPGFMDFTGADGTAPGVVDNPAPIGTTIECDACHADKSFALREVKFPSGEIATGLGHEAICMTCHQGRESSVSLQAAIDALGTPNPDSVYVTLGFKNMHYFPAGATQWGTESKAAAEMGSTRYLGRFQHVEGLSTCIDCHDKHTLNVRAEICGNCHEGVSSEADLEDIRMKGSNVDYDGDGDTTEGLAGEIDTLMTILYEAMVDYSQTVASDEIVYDGGSYPYFFDTNGDRYGSWTPRLLQAAFNYQFFTKDPGAFAHNGHYVIEVLYDAIESLNTQVPVAQFASLTRDASGHFDNAKGDGSHYEHSGYVAEDCARCHSDFGIDEWLAMGGGANLDYNTGYNNVNHIYVGGQKKCTTCHTGENFAEGDAPIKPIGVVNFSSGKSVGFDHGDSSAVCVQCHTGRRSAKYLDDKIAASAGPYSVNHQDPHHLPVAGVRYGSDANVFYEFDTGTLDLVTGGTDVYVDSTDYTGFDMHNADDEMSECAYCHLGDDADHSFEPAEQLSTCKNCHGGSITSLSEIRAVGDNTDWDGDGDATEGTEGEIEGFTDALIQAIVDYINANPTSVSPNLQGTCYYDAATETFMDDVNSDSPGTTTDDVAMTFSAYKFDAAVHKALWNLSLIDNDHGHWAHNPHYVMQLFWDTIDYLNDGVVDNDGSTGTLRRP